MLRMSLARAVELMHPYTSHKAFDEVQKITPELRELGEKITDAIVNAPKDFMFPVAFVLDPETAKLVATFLEICAEKIAHLN